MIIVKPKEFSLEQNFIQFPAGEHSGLISEPFQLSLKVELKMKGPFSKLPSMANVSIVVQLMNEGLFSFEKNSFVRDYTFKDISFDSSHQSILILGPYRLKTLQAISELRGFNWCKFRITCSHTPETKKSKNERKMTRNFKIQQLSLVS